MHLLKIETIGRFIGDLASERLQDVVSASFTSDTLLATGLKARRALVKKYDAHHGPLKPHRRIKIKSGVPAMRALLYPASQKKSSTQ